MDSIVFIWASAMHGIVLCPHKWNKNEIKQKLKSVLFKASHSNRKHLNKNVKTAVKGFSCFIFVSFQFYSNYSGTIAERVVGVTNCGNSNWIHLRLLTQSIVCAICIDAAWPFFKTTVAAAASRCKMIRSSVDHDDIDYRPPAQSRAGGQPARPSGIVLRQRGPASPERLRRRSRPAPHLFTVCLYAGPRLRRCGRGGVGS